MNTKRQLLERKLRKIIREEIGYLTESSAQSLFSEYYKYRSILRNEHFDSYMNSDSPISLFANLLSIDRQQLKKQYSDFLKQTGKPEFKAGPRDIIEFLKTSKLYDQIKIKFKELEKKALDGMESIEQQFYTLYPVLKVIRSQFPNDDSPLMGQKISRDGKSWEITTSTYHNRDIDLTPDEVQQYKKFLSDKAKILKKL
jgi:hypothetical protein